MSELLKSAVSAPVRKLLPEQPTGARPETPVAPSDQKAKLASAFAAELAELREDARSEGYLAGYEAGKADAVEHYAEKTRELTAQHDSKLVELRTCIEQLSTLKTAIETDYQRKLQSVEPAAVAIAFAGITRLLERPDAFQTMLASIVRDAIATFGQQHPLTITVAEADAALLRSVADLQPWTEALVTNAHLARGSCVVDCGPRSLDASLLTQLDQLRHVLLTTAGS